MRAEITNGHRVFFANSCRVCVSLWFSLCVSWLRGTFEAFPDFASTDTSASCITAGSRQLERSLLHVSARCGCDLAKLSPKHSESDVSSSLVAQSFARCLLAKCGPITTNHWNVHCPIINHWNVHGNLYSNSFTLSTLTVLTNDPIDFRRPCFSVPPKSVLRT